ncbi:MAG TPA: non-ribosomal peptide synthetase [Cyanobacteria bacterium UBA11162]|nr:non-ribosomal peptide synthetase [Cyanobacteria bacterium UBA11162]
MKTENIEDIYELSPVQQGILFHSLYAPELKLYFIQDSFTVRGNFNVAAFDRAWQQVAQRHTILRTSFYWEEIDKPLQVVHRNVKVPIEQQDWRGVDPVERDKRLEAFVKSDRDRGFDFSQAPLMRLTLLRLTEDSYQIIWSKHHLILDGWSTALVFQDVIQLYQGFVRNQNASLTPCRPFKDYITWLRKQNLSKAEIFWKQALNGIQSPTPFTNLEAENLPTQEERYDEQEIKLSAATTAALQSLARQHQLTLNTLFQGVWAILLSRYSGQNQVVYGCGVSGRPVNLSKVESMVGVFINTLPVCLKLEPDQFLVVWLKQLQAQQVEMRQYEYTPLVEIQGWSEVPRTLPLFESIVVFENYPVEEFIQHPDEGLEILNFTGFYKTNYALNIIGYPGAELMIGISYDCQRFDPATITGILQHFEIVIQGILANHNARLNELSLLTPVEQQIYLSLEKQVTLDFAGSY